MRCKALQLNIYEDDTYDANGLRTSKTVSGTTTEYYYNGSVLIGMTAGTVYQRFSYDSSGKVVAVDFSTNNGSTFTTYYYLRNGQGDIVKLIDNSGNTVVEYKYDTWGKQLSCTGTLATTLGQNQPFRYRGYVYDTETGWYYLQSRYYDPSIGRFISSDVLLSTGQGMLGHNAYAYCLNNPVNMADHTGYFSITIGGITISAAAILLLVIIVAMLVDIMAERPDFLTQSLIDALSEQTISSVGQFTDILNATTIPKTKSKTEATTRSLADSEPIVEAPAPKALYRICFINQQTNTLIITTGAMTYDMALTMLSSEAYINSKNAEYGKNKWGIYTPNRTDTKALAIVVGATEAAEVHGHMYFGHYHDKDHYYHIFFGNSIHYK